MSQSIVLQFIAQFVRERKEFHSMAAVTYAVKVICIGESKKRLESMLKLFSFSAACFQCGVCNPYFMENCTSRPQIDCPRVATL